MLVFKNHPNRAGADLGRKPVCSVTFFHRLHPYLLWSLRQTGGGSHRYFLQQEASQILYGRAAQHKRYARALSLRLT
jgi:hypothetical protein